MKRREELDKYHDLSQEELRAEAARLKESLFRLNFKRALGEVDAVKRIREEKKSLARIRTIVRQRASQSRQLKLVGQVLSEKNGRRRRKSRRESGFAPEAGSANHSPDC